LPPSVISYQDPLGCAALLKKSCPQEESFVRLFLEQGDIIGMILFQGFRGFSILIPWIIWPSFKSSVQMVSQWALSAADMIKASQKDNRSMKILDIVQVFPFPFFAFRIGISPVHQFEARVKPVFRLRFHSFFQHFPNQRIH
jgi:hypothetical protein